MRDYLSKPKSSLKPHIGHSTVLVGHRLDRVVTSVKEYEETDQEHNRRYTQYCIVPISVKITIVSILYSLPKQRKCYFIITPAASQGNVSSLNSVKHIDNSLTLRSAANGQSVCRN